MDKVVLKKEKRTRRHHRIRAKVSGTALCPRLSVYRSNRALWGQLIDDEKGITLVTAMTEKKMKMSPQKKSFEAGKRLAEMAKKKKIEKVVFDRGGFIYTGSVKAFADGAREGGLSF